MSEHTKGPWKAEQYCVWAGTKYIAGTKTAINTDEQEANARLIAAAPDLLEACKAVMYAVGRAEIEVHANETALVPALNAIRDAVAKATK